MNFDVQCKLLEMLARVPNESLSTAMHVLDMHLLEYTSQDIEHCLQSLEISGLILGSRRSARSPVRYTVTDAGAQLLSTMGFVTTPLDDHQKVQLRKLHNQELDIETLQDAILAVLERAKPFAVPVVLVHDYLQANSLLAKLVPDATTTASLLSRLVAFGAVQNSCNGLLFGVSQH